MGAGSVSDLDDKLREILHDFYYSEAKAPDDQVAQIKQAFADEGWVDMHKGFDKVWEVRAPSPDGGPRVIAHLMDGQEFYQRFKAEMPQGSWRELTDVDILDAAKKAAGLE